MASPHVYAISKRAQQVSETTLYTPLYLTAPYTLTPLTPLTPLVPLTPLHISRYPLTSDNILSQAFETTLALSDEAKKEAAAEGAFVDQSVLILSSSQWSVVSSQ